MGERERVVCMELRTQAGEQHSAHAQSIGGGLSLDVSGQEKLHYRPAIARLSRGSSADLCNLRFHLQEERWDASYDHNKHHAGPNVEA